MLKWVPQSLNKYSDHLCKLAYTRKISTWQHSNILDWLSDLDPGALICTFDGSFKSKLNLGSWGYTIKWQKRGQRSRMLLERAESSQHIGDSFVAETHAAYNLISDLFVMFQHIQFDVWFLVAKLLRFSFVLLHKRSSLFFVTHVVQYSSSLSQITTFYHSLLNHLRQEDRWVYLDVESTFIVHLVLAQMVLANW